MIMKFGTGMKLDVVYTMLTKNVTSLVQRICDVITCILADAQAHVLDIVRQLSSEIKCHVQQFGQKSSDSIKSLSDL